nr:MAG TPA: hypothetical protein [Bacteriophage sp.]
MQNWQSAQERSCGLKITTETTSRAYMREW